MLYKYVVHFVSFNHSDHSACPEGRWGSGCNQMCACLHNASCDPVSGACTCQPGWQGSHCEKPCPEGQYGLDCKESCKCENGVSCDTESGSCTCQPGWMGALCDQPCPVGTHGTNCTSSCQCQNQGTCHPVTGQCQCEPGWAVSIIKPCQVLQPTSSGTKKGWETDFLILKVLIPYFPGPRLCQPVPLRQLRSWL